MFVSVPFWYSQKPRFSSSGLRHLLLTVIVRESINVCIEAVEDIADQGCLFYWLK